MGHCLALWGARLWMGARDAWGGARGHLCRWGSEIRGVVGKSGRKAEGINYDAHLDEMGPFYPSEQAAVHAIAAPKREKEATVPGTVSLRTSLHSIPGHVIGSDKG